MYRRGKRALAGAAHSAGFNLSRYLSRRSRPIPSNIDPFDKRMTISGRGVACTERNTVGYKNAKCPRGTMKKKARRRKGGNAETYARIKGRRDERRKKVR